MDHQMKPLRIKEGEITIVDHLVKSVSSFSSSSSSSSAYCTLARIRRVYFYRIITNIVKF